MSWVEKCDTDETEVFCWAAYKASHYKNNTSSQNNSELHRDGALMHYKHVGVQPSWFTFMCLQFVPRHKAEIQKCGGRWACSWWSDNSCRRYCLPGVELTVAQHEHWAPDGISLPTAQGWLIFDTVCTGVCMCVLSYAILQRQKYQSQQAEVFYLMCGKECLCVGVLIMNKTVLLYKIHTFLMSYTNKNTILEVQCLWPLLKRVFGKAPVIEFVI